VLRRVSDEEPRSIRESNADLPVWLSQIIERLHAKDPCGRFGSAREVALVLERNLAAVQSGLPVPIETRKPAATKPRQGRKAAFAAVFTLSAGLLAVAAYERNNDGFGDAPALAPAGFEQGKSSAVKDRAAESNVSIINSSQPNAIVGSGTMAVKTWDVADFNRIQVRSTFHAKISKGKSFKVTTTADDNVLPYVRVEKEDGTLRISLEKGHSFELTKSPEAEIVLPALSGVDLSGASAGHLEGFDSEKDVAIQVSGSSKLDGSLGTGKAKVTAGGASNVSLTGNAEAAEVTVHGASHLSLSEFPLKQCKIDLSGASTAAITVRSASPFDAKVSGASTLRGTVEAAGLDLKAEGASRTTLTGSAKSAKILASGACHLDLGGFENEAVDIKISGASHAKVAVSRSLDYNASSASHLSYKGSPSHVAGQRTGGSHVSHD
jgi:serine/threonine-protein kinase